MYISIGFLLFFLVRYLFVFFFLMIRRPPRSTRLTHSFPTRRSSDLGGALENERGGHGEFGIQIGIEPGIGRYFGDRDIPRRGNEFREGAVGDRGVVDPERIDARFPARALLGVEIIRSRPEGSAGDQGHAGSGRRHPIVVLRSEEHTSELQSLM